MHYQETIEVKSNLRLVMRERGKIVAKREGHNIFLNTGREWLAQLIAYGSFFPLTTIRDDRVRYMGVGVGGNRQLQLATMSPAVVTAYPGTNIQTDTNPNVTQLERPVRISGGSLPYPGAVGDAWLGQVGAPPVFSGVPPTNVTFVRLFTSTEISYAPFLSVPLSEIGLFTSAASPLNVPFGTPIAYDTFDSLSKTTAFALEVDWTISF